MSPYRTHLPQLDDRLFIADSGMETTLIFHDGIDLPCFASFVLLEDDAGTGIVLETPTWRASADWGAKLGFDAARLAAVNRAAVAQLAELREALETPATPIVISGNLGPRGDGYVADHTMTADQAQAYHAPQIETFAGTAADLVSVFTMTYVEEAIGVARAAQAAGMPVAVSFTLETDGRLPSGMPLGEAIEATDAATGAYPAYYMINCAHPSHFAHVLEDAGPWRARLRGVRANASKRSHAELDEATELDAGNPDELASEYRELRALLPRLAVVGGCCGTDHRHIGAVCKRLVATAT
jgi:homocysteine S-methyltransferase